MFENDPEQNIAPRLLAAIIDRDDRTRLEDILRERKVHLNYTFNAIGTASSEILRAFGLSGTEKTVCVCMESSIRARQLMSAVRERLAMHRPGNGIVFLMPLSGISAAMSSVFLKDYEEHKERLRNYMEHEAELMHNEAKYELVVAVVNQGFSEDVMSAARAHGARGGTIVSARRSDIEDAVKFYGISLQAEKEIVAILIPKSKKAELMQAISQKCGMKSEAHGIVISLPVSSCAGLSAEEPEQIG